MFAFEPDQKSCEEFQRNMKRNQIKNITLIQKALWSDNTELRFIDIKDRGMLMESNSLSRDGETTPVIATTHDNFVNEKSLDRVDFIKMDIEGSEFEVLKGSSNALKQFDVKLAIASYHEVDGKIISEEVEKLLRRYGYAAKTTYPMHLTTYGWKKTKIFKDIYPFPIKDLNR